MTAWHLPPWLRLGGTVSGFFGIKILIGLLLVAASAHQLSVSQFATFSQLFLFLALLSTVSGGGVQGGLIRQIALAAGDRAAERRAVAGALTVWAGFAGTLLLAVAVLGSALSTLLVGEPDLAQALLIVTFVAVLGGGGAILCAVLTGRGRVLLSLGLQAVGMIVGGATCYVRLLGGDAVGAVLFYAAGPLATAALALILTRDAFPGREDCAREAASEARLLLRYSAAGLVVAVTMPVTLFALRGVYREVFGAEQLGYWLAANRVSDVTSQLLGLYMGQVFLPRMTLAAGPAARRLILQTFALGTAMMTAGWLVFLAGAPFFVETFFSRRFMPAIPFIAGYLLGDALRVAASMASTSAAARGRPWLCIGVEASVAALITAYVLVLIALGRPGAPWLGYVLAQATVTVAAFLMGGRLLRADLRRRPASVNAAQMSDSG